MSDETAKPDAPVAQTTAETHATTTVTGDAAQAAGVITGPRFDDFVRAGLCYIVVAGYVISYLYGQITGRQAAPELINTYTNYVMLALGFYLGSSAGSAAKDKLKGLA